MILSEIQQQMYYRGTNNIDEPDLLKSGELRPSMNHLSKQSESGLSVSDVADVGKHFKYMYTVTGDEIGIGSDGEPLLDLSTIKFVKWIQR